MKDSFLDYLVCIWDKDDRLYLRKHFDNLGDALSFASTKVGSYCNTDTVEIFVTKFESIFKLNGKKENF